MSVLQLGRRDVVCITLSDTVFYAPGTGVRALARRLPGDDTWEALRDAMRDAVAGQPKRSASGGGPRLAVALMPPVAPLRFVDLPKMRDDDLHAVLARSADRYFPAVREPQTVSAVRIGTRTPEDGETQASETPLAHYAVVAVSTLLLRAIQNAATEAGCTIERVVPAYSAWAVAAGTRRRASSGANGEASVAIVRPDGGFDVLSAVRGVPVSLRRLRADADDEVLRRAVRLDGAEDVAARQATKTRTLELVTDDILRHRKAVQRTQRMMMAAGLVLAVIAGMGATWWYFGREEARLTAERTAIQANVAKAARVQAAVTELSADAGTLARVEERGARWSNVLRELAIDLPPDAYIEALRAVGDSVVVDGAADNGARAIQAVSASEVLTRVTPSGSIRRDVKQDATGESTLERFTIQARVANAAKLVPPPVRTPARTAPGGQK